MNLTYLARDALEYLVEVLLVFWESALTEMYPLMALKTSYRLQRTQTMTTNAKTIYVLLEVLIVLLIEGTYTLKSQESDMT